MQMPGKVCTMYFVWGRDVKKTDEIILFPFWFDWGLTGALITVEAFAPGQAAFHRGVNPLLKRDSAKSAQGTTPRPPCL